MGNLVPRTFSLVWGTRRFGGGAGKGQAREKVLGTRLGGGVGGDVVHIYNKNI